MATLTQKPSDVIGNGTVVGILHSGFEYATVVEYRGELGPQGARVYRIRVSNKPTPVYVECLENQLVVSQDFEDLKSAISVWPQGKPFTLVDVMGSERWSNVKSPKVFERFVKEKVLAREVHGVRRFDTGLDDQIRFLRK